MRWQGTETRLSQLPFLRICVVELSSITNTNTHKYTVRKTNTNTHKYTVRKHAKSECFSLPRATAVNVEKFSSFFHLLVGARSYAISTSYRIEIGQKLGIPGQCRKRR